VSHKNPADCHALVTEVVSSEVIELSGAYREEIP
jgi:hypothetical protein